MPIINYITYIPWGTRRTTLAGLQQQRRVTHCTVGARHAFDARMRTRLASSVVAESQVRVESGWTLFHARTRRLEHGRRTTGQTVFVGEIAAGFTGPVTRLALCSSPELACFSDWKYKLLFFNELRSRVDHLLSGVALVKPIVANEIYIAVFSPDWHCWLPFFKHRPFLFNVKPWSQEWHSVKLQVTHPTGQSKHSWRLWCG